MYFLRFNGFLGQSDGTNNLHQFIKYFSRDFFSKGDNIFTDANFRLCHLFCCFGLNVVFGSDSINHFSLLALILAIWRNGLDLSGM